MNIYKKTIPYILMGASSLFNVNSARAQALQPLDIPTPPTPTALTVPSELIARTSYAMIEDAMDRRNRDTRLLAKAKNLRLSYVGNVLDTQQKIAPYRGTRHYRMAVLNEMPSAPVGRHCVYGQYTQLMRALSENGDTLTIVPLNGGRACTEFKNQMRNKYRGPEYAGCIHEGRAFESDSAYNKALMEYLRKNGVDENIPSPKRQIFTEKFARTNFSAEQIAPGSIWIVPRYRGSTTKFHAIMFLGRGKIVNGNFVETKDGKFLYAGFNRESIGDVFKTYDMSNVFSASVEDIASIEYDKELRRLESMPVDKMIEYIVNGTNMNVDDLRKMPRKQLLRIVRNKYFGQPLFTPTVPGGQIAQVNIPTGMLRNMTQHTI